MRPASSVLPDLKDLDPQDLALLEYVIYNDSRPEGEPEDWEYSSPAIRVSLKSSFSFIDHKEKGI